ncbi:hypothetical protein HRG84_08560 [Flavisolibacter sp. BT320]|jgi:hypothetical protein|nr:hypothetical protein [Flavisolibacter longurius]
MKKTSVLKFNSLADLAHFLKTTEPESYTINTVRLTLTATISPLEHAVALTDFNAQEIKTASA